MSWAIFLVKKGVALLRVCIIRNADGEMNAQMERVAAALTEAGISFFYLTRNRSEGPHKGFVKKEIVVGNKKVDNYEIQLPALRGGGIKNIRPLLEYGRMLDKWLEENRNQFDVIHAIDYDTGAVAAKIAQKYNKKLVYHIADFYADSRFGIPKVMKEWLKNKEFKVIEKADATIVCTEDRIDQIKGSKPNKLVVIHNTPARTQVTKISDVVEEEKIPLVLTYVGGINRKRFIDKAVEAVEGKKEIQLLLAGYGDLELTNLISEISKSNHNIEYYGKISYDDALQLYSTTDLMFAMYDPEHPNHRYSAANKVYEAMLMGKAIIVARNTGMDRIVADNDIGYVIDYNKESFQNILNHIVQNQDELYRKRVNAIRAYPKYSWEEMKNRLINLYQEI